MFLSKSLKVNFISTLGPLSILVPPALIISQGMGSITALAWVSISCLSWPDGGSAINNNLFFTLNHSALLLPY